MSNTDPRLDEEVARLNKQFYTSFDARYFMQKCSYLLALLAKPEVVKDTLEEGVDFKHLHVKLDGNGNEELFSKQLEKNLKAEIAATYFHAEETLFRIIMAHTVKTNCPWVELTVNSNFSKFKANVDAFVKHKYFTVKHKEGLSFLFYGRTDKPASIEQSIWDKSLENISTFLDYFGRDLLKSYAYNSHKHGLAMFSDEFGFSLGDIMKVDKDDALVFLSYADDKEHPGYKQLHRNFTFTYWERKWSLVYYLTGFLEAIISMGNWRYNDGEYSIRMFDKLDLLALIKDNDNPLQPDTVSESSFSVMLPNDKPKKKKKR